MYEQYRLMDGVSLDEVIKKGAEFDRNEDRNGFGLYLASVCERSLVDNPHINVSLGKCCFIRDYCCIGAQGFGSVKGALGNNVHVPQIGGVVIGNNVRVGSFTNIEAGTLHPTTIGEGSFIDSYVHIGHNCQIGKNVVICAGAILCGGVIIEDDVHIAPGVNILQKVTIGKGSVLGLGALVTKSISGGVLAYGFPAKEHPLGKIVKGRHIKKEQPVIAYWNGDNDNN